MTDIWARTAGNLYLNKKHANNYVSTQIHMLHTANILSLSLPLPVQLSDLIWISDSTSHTAGWGKTGRVGKVTSFNWSCLAVLSWGSFRRRGFPLNLRRKKTSPKCWGCRLNPCRNHKFLCKALTLLCSLFESNSNTEYKCYHYNICLALSSFIVSLWHCHLMCKSQEQDLLINWGTVS